jgi:hypothetical protein
MVIARETNTPPASQKRLYCCHLHCCSSCQLFYSPNKKTKIQTTPNWKLNSSKFSQSVQNRIQRFRRNFASWSNLQQMHYPPCLATPLKWQPQTVSACPYLTRVNTFLPTAPHWSPKLSAKSPCKQSYAWWNAGRHNTYLNRRIVCGPSFDQSLRTLYCADLGMFWCVRSGFVLV